MATHWPHPAPPHIAPCTKLGQVLPCLPFAWHRGPGSALPTPWPHIPTTTHYSMYCKGLCSSLCASNASRASNMRSYEESACTVVGGRATPWPHPAPPHITLCIKLGPGEALPWPWHHPAPPHITLCINIGPGEAFPWPWNHPAPPHITVCTKTGPGEAFPWPWHHPAPPHCSLC